MISYWFDAIVEWCLAYGSWGLAFVSFTEASFFPIPPDVLLIALGIAQPELTLWFALVTTIGSVSGAVFGWWIGRRFGRPVMLRFFKQETVEKVEAYFDRYGGFTLAIAGFTPIPYKVFTIASGMSQVKKRELILWSILGRGCRFFLVAFIILWLGQKAKSFIEEYFGLITVVTVAVVLLGYLLYMVFKRRSHA
ncbi:YqaA family protein [Salinithrix halophila]|uniref:YqaA family protein n=1 Tax=Salinithrix halophila TaxID=1485204 RepID=A0ABV8JCM7_9BACL